MYSPPYQVGTQKRIVRSSSFPPTLPTYLSNLPVQPILPTNLTNLSNQPTLSTYRTDLPYPPAHLTNLPQQATQPASPCQPPNLELSIRKAL